MSATPVVSQNSYTSANSVNPSRAQQNRTRLTYFEEGIRVVTIAYELYDDLPKKNVKFAASIFRKDSDKEVFVRKHHAYTATKRLEKRPMWTTFAPDRYELGDLDRSFYE